MRIYYFKLTKGTLNVNGRHSFVEARQVTKLVKRLTRREGKKVRRKTWVQKKQISQQRIKYECNLIPDN